MVIPLLANQDLTPMLLHQDGFQSVLLFTAKGCQKIWANPCISTKISDVCI